MTAQRQQAEPVLGWRRASSVSASAAARGQPTTILPTGSSPAPAQQAGQPGGFVGPIIGVRPAKTGESYLSVNGYDSYEQWSYTTVDLDNEIKQRWNSVMVK